MADPLITWPYLSHFFMLICCTIPSDNCSPSNCETEHSSLSKMGDLVEPLSRAHVICSGYPMWSHFRGLCVTSARLAAERPITITLLVPHWTSTFERAQKEVSRCLSDVERPLGKIRIVAIGEHSTAMLRGGAFNTADFEMIWPDILQSRPIRCSATGKEYSGLPRPSLAILDGFQYPWFSIIRSNISSSPIPILTWYVCFSGGIIHMGLPEKYGGENHITLRDLTDEEVKRGRPNPPKGKILRLRGLPPMYDWEMYPQVISGIEEFKEPGLIVEGIHHYAKSLIDTDGLVTVNTPAYDGQGLLDVIDEFMSENGKPAFHLGPTIPLQPGTTRFSQKILEEEMAAAPPGIGQKIKDFLDEALERNGSGSVIYIGFGTFFWPSNPEHVWLMLETLADRKIPFVLSHCSPLAKVPEKVKQRFEGSVDGLLVPWAPQQMVLSHKSIGWFVTHGGAGGTMDALTQGVPMIGWPFTADQPTNIVHLVNNLDVAFEFTEMKTGPYANKPIYRTGKTPTCTLEAFREELNSVLDELSSPVGERKRTNAKRHQAELANAWSPDGPAKKSLNALIEKFNL